MLNSFIHLTFKTSKFLAIYAGILFPPNYQANRLDALNYGAIGSTIGHEFSHGFHLNGNIFKKSLIKLYLRSELWLSWRTYTTFYTANNSQLCQTRAMLY